MALTTQTVIGGPDLMHAVNEIREHAPAYELAADYYRGEVSELFCSEAVRRALRGQVAGFDINLARRPVDAVLDRMGITAVTVADDEARTRELVDRVWTPNRMERYSKTLNWAALTYGDAYLIVWPGETDGTVKMHYNTPVTTRVFYSEEDDRTKSYAAKLWGEGHGQQRTYRCDLYYADRIERYATGPGKKGDEPGEWEPFGAEGEAWPLANPFDEVPVFHFRTGEPYGRPEHRGAYGPQNAITKLSASLMTTVDYQIFPQRYALLSAGSPGSEANVDWEDDEDAPTAGDQGGALKASPGTVWELPGVDSVGQFDPANVQAFLEPLNFYARAMSAATATPLRFLEPSGDVPSGESLRADDAPLKHRIEDREAWLGEEYAAALEFAGRVLGVEFGQVDIKWRPVETIDDLAGWQTIQAKQAAGVPARQALTEAGYTSELVETWLAGSDAPNLDTRIAALGSIGSALQTLGSAVQLGAVDRATADAIVAQLLSDLVREPEGGAA